MSSSSLLFNIGLSLECEVSSSDDCAEEDEVVVVVEEDDCFVLSLFIWSKRFMNEYWSVKI